MLTARYFARARKLLSTIALTLFAAAANAAAPNAVTIAEPLRPWNNWVLRDAPDHKCPYLYNSGETRQCTWPAALGLTLDKHGGNFAQRVQVFRTIWVPLPGDADNWPQDVKVDGKPAAVAANEGGLPGIVLPAGAHALEGAFKWDDMPESLQIPQETGLVTLRIDGHDIALPKLDQDGHLWLQSQANGAESGAERLDIHVSRQVDDDIPLRLTTRLEISVSGKNREVVFPAVLLPGFTPVSLASQLPTRLEADGRLRVQVRPGHWELTVAARQMSPQTSVTLPAATPALAEDEVWVFQSHNALRVVTPSGGTPVDAKLVSMPDEWKTLPAFRLKPGEALKLAESKRGDPEAAPDNLNLQRDIWLDFDGGGYTVRDRISGAIHRSWRLDMATPAALGRASVDGQDQFITHTEQSSGVEVRNGTANIVADSRLESNSRALSATGWREDFQSVSAKLNLPPGWHLIAASGVDKAPGSWVAQWSLLDFFVVLIAALAFGKLWGWPWGTAAVVTLALIYHEPGAPGAIWLAVLAGAGLLSVLPQAGRLRRIAVGYRAVALLVLALISLPFAVTQIRQAIYPVLEPSGYAFARNEDDRMAVADQAYKPAPAAAAPAADQMVQEPVEAKLIAPPPPPAMAVSSAIISTQTAPLNRERVENPYGGELNKADPNAIVQTGPGLPDWQWRSYDLQWNGPVEQAQQMHLWLVSPSMSALLAVLRVILVALLFARLLGFAPLLPPRPGRTGRATEIASLLALATCLSLLTPQTSRASDIPDKDMLDQLKTELSKPADCLPNCASIARMLIDVRGESLQVRLEAHALDNTAIPLPTGGTQWVLQSITLDGKPAAGLSRNGDGQMWIALEAGVHQIVLLGAVGHTENVQLSLPLKPHRVDATAEGWTVAGVRENGKADDNLQLTRTVSSGKAALHDTAMPSFIRVQRTLDLGLQWRIHTRIERVAPADGPIFVAVPLLPGESIESSEPRVEKGMAQVNLSPQANTLEWESTLAQRPELVLKAAKQDNMIEGWLLDTSTQWHVELAGIPVILHQNGSGLWQPAWRPWPGEQVTLKISKPLGAPGQSLTLESSELGVTPGLRSASDTLRLVLRSSRGGLHTIKLPENAILQSVRIGLGEQAGQELPIRLEGRELHLPLQPGSQQINIAWRQPGGIATYFTAPEVDVGIAGVNAYTKIFLPEDRWPLALGGPRVGPAILIWGIIVTIALVAFGLSRVSVTPLTGLQWFLLGIGLTQATSLSAALIVGWLLALGYRKRYASRLGEVGFNAGQVLLALWTIVALVCLFAAVEKSLIGYPEMQVTGNGSDNTHFAWYQDRNLALLPQPWVLSLPMLAYRIMMLLWALWLAYSLLQWLRWGWTCFNETGYWRARVKKAVAGRPDAGEEKSAAIEESPPASP